MSELGQEVRRRRLDKGWTQTQLAVFAGVSQPTVNQVETGVRNPSTTTVQKLATALGVGVAELFPKAQSPLPLEGEPLITQPQVQEWLRAHGHRTGEEFLEWAQALGDDDDEEEDVLEAVEQGIRDLRLKRNQILDALRTTEARKTLFPMPTGLSREETKRWLLKPPGRWDLVNELRREYVRRELALTNYSMQLFAEGKVASYLSHRHDPERHKQLLEHRHKVREERRRILEERYAEAVA